MADDVIKTEVQLNPAIRAVEVKLTARIEDEDLVLGLLKESGEDAEERVVYFFDTPGLDLFDAGLVLRARKKHGDVDDTTVKLRPVDPARIPVDWTTTEGFEVEMDRVGDNQIISAKLTAEQDEGEIDEAVDGRRPLRRLFSSDQERLITEFGPTRRRVGGADHHGARSGSRSGRSTRRSSGTRWSRSVGSSPTAPTLSSCRSRSSRARPRRLPATSRAYLESLGLDVGGDQQTKTRGALTFFTTGKGFDA